MLSLRSHLMTDDKSYQPFDQDFCIYLEYHLSKAFKYFEDDQIKDFWCDGIAMPFVEGQLTAKSINDTRKIKTNGWIGVDGQGVYEITISFGPKSLSRYARGLDLRECVPSEESLDWITLLADENKIELRLK